MSELSGRQEAALILVNFTVVIMTGNSAFIAGFNGGLKPLAEHFGVNIADEPAPAAPTPPVVTPPPVETKISLSKVSLTKEKPAISLTKRDNFGEIRINLNWHRGSGESALQACSAPKRSTWIWGPLLSFRTGINRSFRRSVMHSVIIHEPYVQLKGDDRTGDVSDGEWLHINGREWKHIREVLIYAFIYEGVPSWDKTDGVVTIHVPDQPPIETRLTEGENRRTLCAIARLVNENGAIKVERINQYFKGQDEMDRAFGWGFHFRNLRLLK